MVSINARVKAHINEVGAVARDAMKKESEDEMNKKTTKIVEEVKEFVLKYKIPVVLVAILIVASTAITCATCG